MLYTPGAERLKSESFAPKGTGTARSDSPAEVEVVRQIEIAADREPLEAANRATAHLYLANPHKNKKTKEVSGVFDTHPPIEQRVARLEAMGASA